MDDGITDLIASARMLSSRSRTKLRWTTNAISRVGSGLARVRIVKFDCGSANAREGLTENRTQEHIGMSGMYLVNLHADAFHYVYSVLKREHDTLLRRTQEMTTIMDIEVYAVEGAINLPVAQHSLRAIAERKYRHSRGTHRCLHRDVIHLGVADARRSDIALDP